MELTFVTELGESYPVEIDENMELENVMALLEVEVSLNPCPHPCLRHRGSLSSMSLFLRFARIKLIV